MAQQSPDEILEELRTLASKAADNDLNGDETIRLGGLFLHFDHSLLGGGTLPAGWAMSKYSKSKSV